MNFADNQVAPSSHGHSRVSSLPEPLFTSGKLPFIDTHSYAYSNIYTLSLPIPKALTVLTILLPLFAFLSTQSVYLLLKRSSKTLTLPILGLLALQLVYETAITTLALTHILPPSSLTCGLHDRWQELYRTKNAAAIQEIQNALKCCGLNSVVDMAWPWSVNNKASTCSQRFGRKESCFAGWRKSEQNNAGLLVLVAVVVFGMKVGFSLPLLRQPS